MNPFQAQEYTVTVRYQTKSGCNAKTVVVRAADHSKAVDAAQAKVRKMRGVIAIGTADVYSDSSEG